MNISQKKGENSTINLTIALDEKEWKKYEAQALKKLSGEVKVDGFRKGHIPESVLRDKVGEAGILQTAMDLALPQAYTEAIRQEKINPIDQPKVEITKANPLEFTAEVQVYPEVKIGKIDASKIKKEKISITKKDVKTVVDQLRDQLAEKSAVKRASKKGDTAVINFDGTDLKGVPQEGMKSEGHPLELGSNTFIPGFEDEVIGMKADEEKKFDITFPKDYHAANYAGETFTFTVKVTEVLAKKLPKFDADFVKKITGKEQTPEELETEIEGHLKDQKEKEDFEKRQKELFDLIGAKTKAEIPQVFIDDELEGMIDNIKMQGLQAGIPWDKHLENLKKTEEELKTDLLEDAKKAVLSRIGLQELLKTEKIEVSEAEMKEEIAKELAQTPEKNKKEKEHSFQPNHDGWFKVQNRLQIRKLFEKLLK
jgi:trigger factor